MGRTRTRAIHLGVEAEVEAVERLVGIAEAGLLDTASEQPILAARELVLDEHGQEGERGQALALCLDQAGRERIGHAGQAQLAERAIDPEGVHGGSPWVRRSTGSR
jgi:hypothetical protein